MTEPHPPLRARLLREIPLVLGVILGWGLCWWLGRAWVLDGTLWGYRWPDYIAEAFMVSLRQSNAYDPFRSPLHGGLVSMLGQALGSYADAATLIASASTAAMVLSAGLIARALSGPWEGGLAAFATPTVATVAWEGRWANSYALLSGASGLALALGACAAAWPGLTISLASGMATGLAWGVDSRGLLFAPPVAALVFLGATRPGLGWRRWLMLPLFALGMAIGPWSERYFGLDPNHSLSLEQKREGQKEVVERWVQIAPREELQRACAQTPRDLLLTQAFLSTPCSQAVLQHNLNDNLPPRLPFGAKLSLWLLPLTLLPGRRGLRGPLESVLVLGVPLGALLLLSAFTPLPERYIAQWGVPFAIIAPLAIGRLARTLGPTPWGGRAAALACLALGLWIWRADPADRRRPGPDQLDPSYTRWNQAAQVVRGQLGPEDRFLDCSGVYIDLALLPRLTYDPPYINTGTPSMADDRVKRCLSWIESPELGEGHTWMAVNGAETVEYAPVFGGPKRKVDLAQTVADSGRWTLVTRSWDMQLWRWEAP